MLPVSAETRPVAWYVHLPFCPTKCGYCDFYSLPTRPEMIRDLVTAILREADLRDPHRPVRTIFVGGGTPTVLPAEALRAILSALARRLDGSTVEFTCEANPSTADELKLDLLRSCGVNRISFGAQSFNPRELRVLERLHDPGHIPTAVRLAREAGFDNVNLDLISAVPGQSVASWRESLQRALELEPDHIACYSLMYEEGTALTKQLRRGEIVPCDEDVEADMFDATIDELTRAGFEHYEISNFARPGRRCEHNLVYWHNDEYVGIGPSAVSYLDGVRRKNRADVSAYVANLAGPSPDPDRLVVERETLSPRRSAGETAVQMLRLRDGIDAERFRRTTGHDVFELFREPVARHREAGHLVADERGVRLTRTGLLLANRVMADFL